MSGTGASSGLVRHVLALCVLWVVVCAVALATWYAAPETQHVLEFAGGGAWGIGVVALYVTTRGATGRRTAPWAIALIGVPIAVAIALGIVITWELFSPMGVAVSTPLRAIEVFLAFALGRVGARRAKNALA